MGIEELQEILEGEVGGIWPKTCVLTRPLWKKLGTWALPASMGLTGLVQEAWGEGQQAKSLQITLDGRLQKSDFPSF